MNGRPTPAWARADNNKDGMWLCGFFTMLSLYYNNIVYNNYFIVTLFVKLSCCISNSTAQHHHIQCINTQIHTTMKITCNNATKNDRCGYNLRNRPTLVHNVLIHRRGAIYYESIKICTTYNTVCLCLQAIILKSF